MGRWVQKICSFRSFHPQNEDKYQQSPTTTDDILRPVLTVGAAAGECESGVDGEMFEGGLGTATAECEEGAGAGGPMVRVLGDSRAGTRGGYCGEGGRRVAEVLMWMGSVWRVCL